MSKGATIGDAKGITLRQLRQFISTTASYPDDTVVNGNVTTDRQIVRLSVGSAS